MALLESSDYRTLERVPYSMHSPMLGPNLPTIHSVPLNQIQVLFLYQIHDLRSSTTSSKPKRSSQPL